MPYIDLVPYPLATIGDSTRAAYAHRRRVFINPVHVVALVHESDTLTTIFMRDNSWVQVPESIDVVALHLTSGQE